ncbi:unnamed protein product, partial [Polarella glacialis]
ALIQELDAAKQELLAPKVSDASKPIEGSLLRFWVLGSADAVEAQMAAAAAAKQVDYRQNGAVPFVAALRERRGARLQHENAKKAAASLREEPAKEVMTEEAPSSAGDGSSESQDSGLLFAAAAALIVLAAVAIGAFKSNFGGTSS